jgi:hypothetical protein
MQTILILQLGYPLTPLCRALKAGGATCTVTDSVGEWQHLARIRPWSLLLVAAVVEDDLERLIHNRQLPLAESYLLTRQVGVLDLSIFQRVWTTQPVASDIL